MTLVASPLNRVVRRRFFDAKIDFRPRVKDRHESNKEIVLKFCFRRHWSFRRRGSVNLLLLQVVQVSDVFKLFTTVSY